MEDIIASIDSAVPILQQLPPGILPRWVLFVGVVGLGNTIQNFITASYSKRIYAGKPDEMTPLAQRLFGVWTLSVSVIRFYGAFNLNDPNMYQLVMWTYAIAMFHFGSELIFFKGSKLNGPIMFPVTIAIGSLYWLYSQYGFYVQSKI